MDSRQTHETFIHERKTLNSVSVNPKDWLVHDVVGNIPKLRETPEKLRETDLKNLNIKTNSLLY